MAEKVLIASSSTSKDEYIPVAEGLQGLGHDVVIYNSDEVLNGSARFTVSIDQSGQQSVSYDHEDISNEVVSAMWYRKVAEFQRPQDSADKAKLLILQDEIAGFHDSIWSLYDDEKWLNSPESIKKSAMKLGQLVVARNVGFDIPETVVSSEWDDVRKKLFEDQRYNQIIAKMMRGVIIENNVDKAMPTTILDESLVQELKGYTVPFPGMYQPFLQKSREWRVTAVGDQVFPVAIYTDEEAKNDWRNYQHTDMVDFRPETLPEDIEAKCIDFLAETNQKFGAFDFVEDDDGRITFLECNSNGQYYAFEELFGMPISEAIINELHKIATTK